MDIRDILKSFDQLSEGDSTVHKAGPGGYGNRHGSEDVTDQYGKPIGRASLSKMSDAPAVKRGKGRPPKNADASGEVKSYDSSALSKAMGMGKAPKPSGKPSVKHSLKEYFDQMDEALQEAALAVQPMPATPQQKQQQQMATKPSFMIKDPANPNMPAITTQDPAVVQAAKSGTMSMQKPGAAPTTPGATPATGAGSQVAPMKETGDNWIKDATKNKGAFTAKAKSHGMTPAQFRAKVLAHKEDYPAKTEKQAQLAKTLSKMHEADSPQYFAQSSPLSTTNRDVLEGKKGVNPFAKKEETDKKKCPPMSHVKKMCQDGKSVAEICKMHPDCNQKELKQMVADCKKKLSEGVAEGVSNIKRKIIKLYNQGLSDDEIAEQLGIDSYDVKSVLDDYEWVADTTGKEIRKTTRESAMPMKKVNGKSVPAFAADGKGKNDLTKKGAAPKKGVNPFAKKTEKKKVKEGMEHHLQAARLEGKSHALRKMPYNCTHDNMEEARCYHDGFKEGLDECYGQMPILGRTRVGEVDEAYVASPSNQYDHYGDEASPEEHKAYQDEINLYKTPGAHPALASIGMGRAQDMNSRLIQTLQKRGKPVQQAFGENEVGTMASYGADELGEMDKTSYMKQQAIKTPGNTFKAFGQTMSDKNVIDEFAFEALDKQLNAILEGKEVSEGMTVSISKGQQGSPDSVSVSAQDGEADQLLSIIKSAGMGLFGGDEQNGYGAPQGSTAAPGGIEVVDDHDGMMALMKKLSGGGEMQGGGDYEDEEGSSEEGHMHSEETCNECGGMMEAGHSCGSKEMVDEVESEDQMAYEVAETNAPDSGADNTNADVAGNAAANSALATADAGEDEEEGQVYSQPMSEDGDDDAEANTEVDDAENIEEGDHKDDNCKKCDCSPCKCETVAESFANLYKKLAFLSEESTEKEDEKAEKAGKKVAKDIEYDDKKDKKKIDEWANEAGKNGTDAAFEADIDYMTKIISGGLNKQKSTGQTTIPVTNGQKSRMGVDGLGSPMKESTDLLKDYLKLSGL